MKTPIKVPNIECDERKLKIYSDNIKRDGCRFSVPRERN